MNDHECVYKDNLLWWKAEALLGAMGKGTQLLQLIIAAVVPIPVPREIAEDYMEKAKNELTVVLGENNDRRIQF